MFKIGIFCFDIKIIVGQIQFKYFVDILLIYMFIKKGIKIGISFWVIIEYYNYNYYYYIFIVLVVFVFVVEIIFFY